jgi:hypothetical protein
MLPVEIWLEITQLLSWRSLKSLAQCCSWLDRLVHTKAPFRILVFVDGGKAPTKKHCNHHSLLQSAFCIVWEPSRRSGRRISDSTFSSGSRSFRLMLSSLSRSTSLRFLSLNHMDIVEAQQIIIFSIPSLRTLELRSAYMLPTTRALPASQITHLILGNPTAGPPTFHLLKHVATSLETLKLNGLYPIDAGILAGFRDGRVHLLNLRSFVYYYMVYPGSLDIVSIWQCVGRHASITSLEISTISEILMSQPDPQLLPNLRDLTCDWIVATSLVPGRPVISYRQQLGVAPLNDLPLFIASLAKSQAGIRRAHLFIYYSFTGYLHYVASQLPLLEVLDIFVEDALIGQQHLSFTPYINYPVETEERMFPSLSGGWIRPPEPDGSLRCLRSLREIRVYVERPRIKNAHVLFYDKCRVLLENHLMPMCPALETFECRAVQSRSRSLNTPFDEEVPREWEWKVKRKGNGEWEGQMEPPTIAFETLGRTRVGLLPDS